VLFDPPCLRRWSRAAAEVLFRTCTSLCAAQGNYTIRASCWIPAVGKILTATYIDKLLNHNRINPISDGRCLVYC